MTCHHECILMMSSLVTSSIREPFICHFQSLASVALNHLQHLGVGVSLSSPMHTHSHLLGFPLGGGQAGYAVVVNKQMHISGCNPYSAMTAVSFALAMNICLQQTYSYVTGCASSLAGLIAAQRHLRSCWSQGACGEGCATSYLIASNDRQG